MAHVKKKHYAVIVVAVLVVAAASVYAYQNYFQKRPTPAPVPFHEHVNFALFINGTQFNFNQSKYMTTEEQEVGLRADVHMHDMNGGVIHLHAPGITLGMFFESLGMSINSSCLTLDNGKSYCDSGENTDTLKLYVNGVQSSAFGSLQLHDLDRILVTFGSDPQQSILNQINSVPTDACIYSEKCPAPPGFVNNESASCVGGQATVCSAE